jgi:hypothetical protein
VQPIVHAVRDVAFKVTVVPPMGVVVGGAGMTQPVWQFAACELHNIMQFVTVEVMGVESPTKGGVTFGGVVAACPSATSCAPHTFPDHHSPMYVRGERVAISLPQ